MPGDGNRAHRVGRRPRGRRRSAQHRAPPVAPGRRSSDRRSCSQGRHRLGRIFGRRRARRLAPQAALGPAAVDNSRPSEGRWLNDGVVAAGNSRLRAVYDGTASTDAHQRDQGLPRAAVAPATVKGMVTQPATSGHGRDGQVPGARSVGSQFFIVLMTKTAPRRPIPTDRGNVTSGMETADAIFAASGDASVPANPIKMTARSHP